MGDKEMSSQTVNVRTRDNKVHGEKSVADVIARFGKLVKSRSNDSEDNF